MVQCKGRVVCKRHAPWDLTDKPWISKDGQWGPRHCCGYMNNWNLPMLLCLRSNHNIKLITNGADMKQLTWYITKYTLKKQVLTSNMSALLARRLAFNTKDKKLTEDCHTRNNCLLQQCINTLSREPEFSRPEVINYLMRWGDHYMSHHFVEIYLDSITGVLKHAEVCQSMTCSRNVVTEMNRYGLWMPGGETHQHIGETNHLPEEDNTQVGCSV
jgi:hypothetical protein